LKSLCYEARSEKRQIILSKGCFMIAQNFGLASLLYCYSEQLIIKTELGRRRLQIDGGRQP